MMENMQIKTYTTLPEEARAIRETVFVNEQGFKEEFDTADQTATHFVLFDGEKPIATSRILTTEEEGTYFIGRIAVLKEYRGQHLGTTIVNAAENYARERGGTKIRLHAQCQAVPFYEKIGYESVSGIDYEEDCPHVWMRKIL